jgi:hypothetical protein
MDSDAGMGTRIPTLLATRSTKNFQYRIIVRLTGEVPPYERSNLRSRAVFSCSSPEAFDVDELVRGFRALVAIPGTPGYRIGKSWRSEPREILEWWRARTVGKQLSSLCPLDRLGCWFGD